MRQNHIWGLVRALVLGASLILSTAAPGVTNISQARPSGAGNRPDDSRAASLATVQPAADASFATVFGRSPQTPVTAGQLAAYIPPDHVAHGLPRTLAGAVTGPQKVLVLRVYFADYPNTSRYSKSEVESFFGELNQLWQHNSYGQISITYEVSSLFQMPDNRSAYIDDGGTPGTCAETSQGDLSCGGKYLKILTDAVNNAPDGLDWTDLDDVMVVMAETDPSQFHRGQSLCPCVLPAGPGSDDDMNVDGAIFSENPSESDVQVWGRWAHEIGHAFQQDGPPHPSNYNSEFELMDANYPGQTGVFEKQDDQAYPGWLPPAKYETVTPSCDVGPDPCTGLGGGTIPIWAEEYDPSAKPNIQAVKAYITDNLYYLISVRRRVNGDELNGDFVGGIPDEGVLIERVEEQADQWVTVQGPGGDRNKLWHAGNLYTSADDGIFIQVVSKVDDDNYVVSVSYDQDAANQPDVMLYPWVAPPANTWETTDIWIDSPANGYNTYRYGTWNDLSGNPVPVGNGDEPTIGQVNRLYARVRNVGGAPATNVVVHFEITDPPGLGINDQTSWVSLGTVTAAEFPALSNIDPGEFVDVFLNWTPDYDIPDDQVEDGSFAFHTCPQGAARPGARRDRAWQSRWGCRTRERVLLQRARWRRRRGLQRDHSPAQRRSVRQPPLLSPLSVGFAGRLGIGYQSRPDGCGAGAARRGRHTRQHCVWSDDDYVCGQHVRGGCLRLTATFTDERSRPDRPAPGESGLGRGARGNPGGATDHTRLPFRARA